MDGGFGRVEDGASCGTRSVAASLAAVSLAALEARITELAGHLNAANAQWLALIAEFDRRAGWSDGATKSCAHWLNWKCGLDLGAAREKLRVAHALEALPRVRAAMARGELSYSKVRAITRVADAATEGRLLQIALHGTAHHVEAVVREFRRARDAAELSREARQQAARRVSAFFDDDGSLVLSARLPAEAGMALMKALDVAVEDVSAETSAAASAPRAARRADALARIAESFLQHGLEAMGGGDRHQVVVHVDVHSLRGGGSGDGASCCGFEHGPGLPAETLRRLACDSSRVTLVEGGRGEPLDVGRKTRSIPPALRRALQSRDRGCRFPGCTHTRFVDAHHIRHWAHGGETRLGNLVTLCRFHHRAVHEGGARIEVLDDGALRFLNARGEVCLPSPALHGGVGGVVASNAAAGVEVDASTAVSGWRGERLDHALALASLLSVRRGTA